MLQSRTLQSRMLQRAGRHMATPMSLVAIALFSLALTGALVLWTTLSGELAALRLNVGSLVGQLRAVELEVTELRARAATERAARLAGSRAAVSLNKRAFVAQHGREPHVLLYTFQSSGSRALFDPLNYWRECWARHHGYAHVIRSEIRLDVDEGHNLQSNDSVLSYSDYMMFAWIPVLIEMMENPPPRSWDLVYYMDADTIVHYRKLGFSIADMWEGHELTVMDIARNDWCYNKNGLLFKRGPWALQFLKRLLRMRDDAQRGRRYLQGDNGAFCELLLRELGDEADAAGLTGYNRSCDSLAQQNPFPHPLSATDRPVYIEQNRLFSRCFFNELERLAGPFGTRHSRAINFVPLDDTRPWGNCWYALQASVPEDHWRARCLATHMNGPAKNAKYIEWEMTRAIGALPFPSCPIELDWANSPLRASAAGLASDGN